MTAWAALILWPFLGIALFRALSPATALSVTLVGGLLLLPERVAFDLPMLPALDKDSIPVLAALVMALGLGAAARGEVRPGWLPRDPLLLICMGLFVLGGLGTALSNAEPAYEGRFRQGLTLYDGFSLALSACVALLPFLLGRRFLSTEAAQARFLVVFVAAMSGYALLALYEVRMSPQINNIVYGFFPHSWLQHVRGNGFRPLVFLSHGLVLSLLLCLAVLATAGFARRRGGLWWLVLPWLFGTLVLSKSLGALMIAVLLLPAALFLPARLRFLTAAVIACIALFYPVVRSADLVPTESLLSLAQSIDTDRAGSLATRIDSEDVLLARAAEKPLFGWGGYGRERVYVENVEQSISDGAWVILFGQGGWARYLGVFGLLTWSVIAMTMSRGPMPPTAPVLALMLAANLLDLIPNSGLTPVTWMMAGALTGLRERLAAGAAEPGATAAETGTERGRLPQAHARSAPGAAPAGKGPARDLPYRRDHGPAPRRRPLGHARELDR